MKTKSTSMVCDKNGYTDTSRRRVIQTLSLGMGFASLPTYMSAEMTSIPLDSLDPGERIIPLEEREISEMQKFIEECISASKDSEPQLAIEALLKRNLSEPRDMLNAIGEPTEAGLKVFLRSKELTIFAATWTPQMNLMPHNHLMWANIGIYTGREDNILWKRTKEGLVAKDVQCLFAGDVARLHTNAIHSVTNPLRRFTGGLHIYGGDFFATERSQWDAETLHEEPSNGEVIRQLFKEANDQMKRLNN